MENRHFTGLSTPKPDPIFALSRQAKECGPEAIDATIGVCMDEQSSPLVFSTVREAEEKRVREMQSDDFSYPPILGLERYRNAVQSLILGASKKDTAFASFSAAGGQGALHTNLNLLKRMMPDVSLIVPVPAWGNHYDLLRGANIPAVEAATLDQGKATTDAIVRTLQSTSGKAAVLLQVSGHNPTGLDFNLEQWRELADAMERKNAVAFLDCAYQGLTDDPESDALVPRLFARRDIATLISWSASKNHSMYGYRTGLAGAMVKSDEMKRLIEGHYSDVSDELQSAAPSPGQAIVSIVQERLKEEWLCELESVRTLIARKRTDLTRLLGMEEFSTALQGKGLFAKLPLDSAQLERLREEKKVFLLDDGRINIAGVPLSRIGELAEKILSVVRR